MKQKNYIILSPDLDVLYVDPESCCYCAYGDEIYNEDPKSGPVFRFAMPGIEEWQKRYEYATDFTNTMTDPSFDWKTWHYEGLCFAKAIWENIPRSFKLYYKPPYEDRSNTIIGEIEINEHTDLLIEKLRMEACLNPSAPSFTDNLEYETEYDEQNLKVLFKNNRLMKEVRISSLSSLKCWLKQIIDGSEPVCTSIQANHRLHVFKQTVGSHPEMAQLWITNSVGNEVVFNAYVNTRNFVKGLYLSLLTELGFYIYKDIDNYPSEDEKNNAWTPYNQLKSRLVESFINGQKPMADEDNTFVNETYVMFPDWGGCIFWDTMGVGSGGHEKIYRDYIDCADIKLDVLGLKKWSEYYDNHDDSQSFEEYWLEGWNLAKQVRRQLPDNIDLYYMCYDPKRPDEIIDYESGLPRLIVPKQE